MKNAIKFLTIAILIGISFLAAKAQESTVAVNSEITTEKVEKKVETPKTKQSSKDDNSWTGFYVGGFGGYTNGKANPRTSTIVTTVFTGPNAGIYAFQFDVDEINKAGNQRISSNSINGGADFGYNYQKGKFVIGGEVDFGMNRINKSVTNSRSINPAGVRTYTVTQTVKSDWMMTARPRAGVALKKALFYVTGGLAVTNVKYDERYSGSVGSVTESGSFSKTKAGWTAGVGTEVKVTNRLSVKGEYLFSNFGRTTTTSTNAADFLGVAPGQVFTHSTDLRSHSLRFGINYRF